MFEYYNLIDLQGIDCILIPFTKDMSSAESEYCNLLLGRIQDQLQKASDWLGSEEAEELYKQQQRYIDDFFENFEDSELYDKLSEMVNSKDYKDIDDLLEKFYKMGSKLGYDDLKQKLNLTDADKKALQFIKDYNYDLIQDIDKETLEGIRTTIFDTALSGKGYTETAQRLEELPLTPITSRVSLRSRCEMIARTEHARAVNTGTLQSYANYGVEQVNVITVGSLACNLCKDLEAKNPWTLKEAQSMLPVHPNCRCAWSAYLDLSDLPSLEEVENPIVINNPQTEKPKAKAKKTKIKTKKPVIKENDKETKGETTPVTPQEDELGFTSDGYTTVQNFMKKRSKMKSEYGCIADYKTGEVYSPEFHGGKGSVRIPETQVVSEGGLNDKQLKKLKKEDPFGLLAGKYDDLLGKPTLKNYVQSDSCTIIHNHPSDGFHNFSGADLRIAYDENRKINHIIAVSEKETWIAELNKNADKKRASRFFSEWDHVYKDVNKFSKEDIGKRLQAISELNLKDHDAAKKKLAELDKFMKGGGYDDFVNDMANEKLVKLSKEYDDVITLKNIKNDKFNDMIDNLKATKTKKVANKIKETKTKSKVKDIKEKLPVPDASPSPKSKPFKPSNYKADTEDKLLKKQNDVQNKVKFTSDEKKSVGYWQGDGYSEINGKIYNTESYRGICQYEDDVPGYNKELDTHMKNIDSAINKSPGLTQDTILYRAGHWDSSLKKGDKGTFKGYSSTSYSDEDMDMFSGFGEDRYTIEIYADKGTKGISINDTFGGMSGEKEFLLPRNQNYEVIDVDNRNMVAKIHLLP